MLGPFLVLATATTLIHSVPRTRSIQLAIAIGILAYLPAISWSFSRQLVIWPPVAVLLGVTLLSDLPARRLTRPRRGARHGRASFGSAAASRTGDHKAPELRHARPGLARLSRPPVLVRALGYLYLAAAVLSLTVWVFASAPEGNLLAMLGAGLAVLASALYAGRRWSWVVVVVTGALAVGAGTSRLMLAGSGLLLVGIAFEGLVVLYFLLPGVRAYYGIGRRDR